MDLRIVLVSRDSTDPQKQPLAAGEPQAQIWVSATVGTWTSPWPQVAARISHINLASRSSMAYRHRYGFTRQHRSWTSAWPSMVTWTMDINPSCCRMAMDTDVALKGSMGLDIFKWLIFVLKLLFLHMTPNQILNPWRGSELHVNINCITSLSLIVCLCLCLCLSYANSSFFFKCISKLNSKWWNSLTWSL